MMKGVNLRFSATNAAAPAMRQVQRDLAGVGRGISNHAPLMRSWNAGLNSNRRAVQQFGFQMSDFAIQIAGGQSAMLAFTQQGGQMLQFFGPAGSIMAAFLAVFGSLAIAFTRSGKALSDLFPLMGVLQDEFRTLGDVLRTVKEAMIDFANLIVNNLDVILIAASLVAGYMATKWVSAWLVASGATAAFRNVLAATALSYQMAGAGAAAATVATSVFTTAINVLRIALMRLGIPLLIIGLAYLIERFIALSQAAGGFGNLMKALGSLVAGVFTDMVNSMKALYFDWIGRYQALQAEFALTMADMVDNAVWFGNRVVGVFRGAYNAMVEIWKNLPAALGDFMFSAVNTVIDGVEWLLGKVTDGLNLFISGLNQIPGVDIDRLMGVGDLNVENPYAGAGSAAAQAAVDAFTAGFNTDTFDGQAFGQAIRANAADLFASASTYEELAQMFSGLPSEASEAWQVLRELWDKAQEDQFDVRDWFAGAGTDGEGGGGSGGPADAMREQAEEIEKIFNSMRDSIASSMMSSFKAVLAGTKSLADAARDMLSSIIDKVIELLMTPVFNNIATSLTGAIMGGLGSIGANVLPSFEGGGFTWRGPRAGGLDGRGGRMAILHPNERVIDGERGSMRDGGMNVYITVNTPDADSFRRSQRQIVREMRGQMAAMK